MSAWKAGDKAVCVDDNFTRKCAPDLWSFPFGYPKNGVIYLVTDVIERRFNDCVAARLVIAGFSQLWDGEEHGFRLSRFRRVVTATEREAIGMARLMEDLA